MLNFLKKNYREILCIVITLGLISLGVFVFSGFAWRIVESGRDFGVSVAYWFCEHLEIEHSIEPTLFQLPTMPPWTSTPQVPSTLLPDKWEAFVVAWGKYWKTWASVDTLVEYLIFLLGIVFYIVTYFFDFLLISFVVRLIFDAYLNRQNNDDDKESAALKGFKVVANYTYRPVWWFLVDMYNYIKDSGYWKVWLSLLALYLNVLSIVLETLSVLFYFVVSFDFLSIYTWAYKLIYDLSTFFTHVPLWVIIIAGVIIYETICRNLGYDELYHRERRNRGLLNERGVVTIVWGEMGTGKTALITDCMLSAEVQLRDDALEVILESDMKFPRFTWATFERQIRQAVYFHVIYDVWSCRRFVKKKYRYWQKSNCRERIFGYDYERYGLTYNDELKEISIWQVLEDYACAYLIYTVQSSLIVANYSIRVDSLLADLGNFPLWNSDFFKRDSRLLDSFSRHCHILDFDMLRLGKIMLERNPNRNAYGFGVWGVTELDKERKNTPELKDVKATDEECNQRNDLFNILLKMSRHACVIANRVFVKVFADLQRPESLGADCRELGEITYIAEKGEDEPVLPFFSLYYILEAVIDWVYKPFEEIYLRYRFNRSDNTLPMYLYKGITARLKHIKERTRNLFGSSTLLLEVQSGRMDGVPKRRKYFRQRKKIYSRRYSTDCQQAIFERRSEMNFIGIDDMREYADDMASADELAYQNSHMQVELLRCVA